MLILILFTLFCSYSCSILVILFLFRDHKHFVNIHYFYRCYPTSVTVPYGDATVPYYTVCDGIFENTIVTFIVTFKHRYKDRHIKRYFFKNNSVTENIPLHLPYYSLVFFGFKFFIFCFKCLVKFPDLFFYNSRINFPP